jgi:hypothetical protein
MEANALAREPTRAVLRAGHGVDGIDVGGGSEGEPPLFELPAV